MPVRNTCSVIVNRHYLTFIVTDAQLKNLRERQVTLMKYLHDLREEQTTFIQLCKLLTFRTTSGLSPLFLGSSLVVYKTYSVKAAEHIHITWILCDCETQ